MLYGIRKQIIIGSEIGMCSAPSQFLNKRELLVIWTPSNKFKQNLHPDTMIFIQENAFENDGH